MAEAPVAQPEVEGFEWRHAGASGDGSEPIVPNTFEPAAEQHFEETVVEPAAQSPQPYHELTGTTYQRVDLEPRDVPETWAGVVEQSAVPVWEPESPAPAANHIDEPLVLDGEISEPYGEPDYGTPVELPHTSFVTESRETQHPEPESLSDAPLPSQPAPTWGLGEPYEAAAPVIDVGAGRQVEEDADTEASQDPPLDLSVPTWAFEAPDEESDALEPTAEPVAEPQQPTAYTHPMAAPDDEPADHDDAVAATVVAAAVAGERSLRRRRRKRRTRTRRRA